MVTKVVQAYPDVLPMPQHPQVKSCVAKATIIRTLADEGWFGYGCTTCGTKAGRKIVGPNAETQWERSNCFKTKSVFPKIRVVVAVEDKSGTTSFVLFETQLAKVLKKSVSWLYNKALKELGDPSYFQDKAILAPTNEEVAIINEHVLSTIDCEEIVYYSSDSLCPDENNDLFAQKVYSPEILNGLKVPGVPNHRLALKRGVPIMLLRNIDQSKGLCNGTTLIVERLGEHTIEARIITGQSFGNITYIPRMIVAPTNKKIAIKFQRRQFPITVCFAMTINKSQGQSLNSIGLFLRKPVFTHGQLYVSNVQNGLGLTDDLKMV
ncbi:uncharacterized protein [Rutidosis leptorrhynchoides]|uniref:uncharacterized protein n=1 Tax=Rutidosis leptorrhynchoides TaxID=125765 RepID=UPI003A99E9DC